MFVVQALKALGNEMRARMVHLLHERQLNVGEIMQTLDIRQSRASRHLKILSEAGLLESRREGLCCFYKVSGVEPVQALVKSLSPLFAQESAMAEDLRRAEEVRARRMAETRRFFDEIAGEWDKVNQEIMGDFDLHGAVADRLSACGSVADLGCGTGILLARLEAKAERIIGVDSSPGMLELAERRFNGRSKASLRLGDLCHLPLRDNEADGAVMCMVLHHLNDPAKALAEAGRIVGPGGRLVLADFGRHENEEMRAAYADQRLGFDPEEIEAMLASAGFAPEARQEYGVNKDLTVFVYECTKA